MNKHYPLSKSEQGLYISSLNSGDAYNLAHTVNLVRCLDPNSYCFGPFLFIQELLYKLLTIKR